MWGSAQQSRVGTRLARQRPRRVPTNPRQGRHLEMRSSVPLLRGAGNRRSPPIHMQVQTDVIARASVVLDEGPRGPASCAGVGMVSARLCQALAMRHHRASLRAKVNFALISA